MFTKIPRILLEPLGEAVSYKGATARAVEQYMRNPSDDTYDKLFSVTSGSKQSLADMFYSILRKKPSELTYRHAAMSFWNERRLLEAGLCCEKLKVYLPGNVGVIRMSALIAGSRGDVEKLRHEISEIQRISPLNGCIGMLHCLYYFINNEYSMACSYAEEALRVLPSDRDPFAARLAVDAALRAANGTLLTKAILLNGSDIGRAQQKDALALLKRHLVELLRRRPITEGQAHV